MDEVVSEELEDILTPKMSGRQQMG